MDALMVAIAMATLPGLAVGLVQAAKRQNRAFDFAFIGAGAWAFVVYVRVFMDRMTGGAPDVYGLPTLVVAVVGLAGLRWIIGREVRPPIKAPAGRPAPARQPGFVPASETPRRRPERRRPERRQPAGRPAGKYAGFKREAL